MDLEFTPDTTKNSFKFSLADQNITVPTKINEKLDTQVLQSSQTQGSTMSTVNNFAGSTAEASSLLLSFLSLDASGSLMKLSQMNKVFCRFRFLEMNYGPYLMAYFQFSAEKFDPPSKEKKDVLAKNSSSYRHNMLSMKVQLDIFSFDLLRVILYSTSWIIKLIAYRMLKTAKSSGQIGKINCYVVWISQKFHMVILNSIAMDLIPYSLRTIFHSKGLPAWIQLLSIALLSLLIYDFLEIELIGSRAIIREIEEPNAQENGDKPNREPKARSKANQVAPVVQDSVLDLNPKNLTSDKIEEERDSNQIDYPATIKRLDQNLTVMHFSTNDLQQKKSYSGNRIILMSNFSFLLKLSVMQVILVGFNKSPVPAFFLLLSLELAYLGINVVYFFKHQHLKSIILLIPKIAQPLALILAEVVMLVNLLGFEDKNSTLTEPTQRFLIKVILYSNILEYVFLVLNIILIIKIALSDRQRMKSDSEYKKMMESKSKVIIYKSNRFVEEWMVRWVEKSRLEVEEQRRKYVESNARRAERRAKEKAAKNGGQVSF